MTHFNISVAVKCRRNNAGNYNRAVFMDLSNVFDSVNHDLLAAK